MAEFIVFMACVVAYLLFMMFALINWSKQAGKAKERLIWQVEKIGGRQVKLRKAKSMQPASYAFVVTYIDEDGVKQERTAFGRKKLFHRLHNDFYWAEEALHTSRSSNQTSNKIAPTPRLSSSKEQIISEQAAEIDRLKTALEHAQSVH